VTLSTSNPRAKQRWLSLVTAVSAAILLLGTAVFANIGASKFEGGDGNMVVNTTGNLDWANVTGLHTGIDKPSGKTDNSFGQGTKEDNANVTVVTGSIPPNKNDLTRFYEASENIGGATYLYLAWERAVNIGNANLDFEINQHSTTGFDSTTTGDVTLNRTAGDVLVTYDFAGSGTPTLGILRWLTSASVPVVVGFSTNSCFAANSFPCWGDRITLNGTNSEGAVNTSTISEPFVGTSALGIGLFGEASINLTAAGVFPPGTCEAFGSTFVKSRSSSSFPAELKDFIAPVAVNISNCATVITRKVTDPAGSSESFGFTTNVATSPATTTSPFSLTGVTTGDANVNTIVNVLPGSYNTAEGTKTGWTLTSIDCSASVMSGTAPATSLANRNATYTVQAGDVVDCTFTNTKDKANPSAVTHPTLIPQDSATISGFDTTGSKDGALTLSLYDNSSCDTLSGHLRLYTESVGPITANTTYKTNNSGVPATGNGYTITQDGTYYWQAVYGGDTRNNGFTTTCTAESYGIEVTPNP
jgi:hypothetical protein